MTLPLETPPQWRQQAERSNLFIMRVMVWISLTFGRPLGRLVLLGIALYFTLFMPQARRASRDYLSRVLDRPAGFVDAFRHVHAFASTIHDRIYLLNDRFDLFDIEVIGSEAFDRALEEHPAVLLMGGHLGSFEVLRAMATRHAGMQVAMLMYEDNAQKLNDTLRAINPAAADVVIPLGHPESMLMARDRLEAGTLVGMLADRRLGDDPAVDHEFLGDSAAFPLGPWRAAALLKRPVFFMAGLYLGANRYQVHLVPLADFSTVDPADRPAAMAAAMDAYVRTLATYCRRAPYNWFNFFNFWQKKCSATS